MVDKIDKVIALAKSLVGKSGWKWGAIQSEAPEYFDCSSLTIWIFSVIGIWLPRRPYQQCDYCEANGRLVDIDELLLGDLLFLDSPCAEIKSQLPDAIGHVCIASENQRVICATNSELGRGVVEISLKKVLTTRKFHSGGRLIELDQ